MYQYIYIYTYVYNLDHMVDLVSKLSQENPLDLLQDQLFGGGQDLLRRRGSTGVVGKLQKIQKKPEVI